MLTAEVAIILFAREEVEATISVLIDVADDFGLQLIEDSLGVIAILPFNEAVLFTVGQHDAEKVVWDHDIKIGLRFIFKVDGHQTFKLLIAFFLFEILLILLHSFYFFHQVEIANLFNVFPFAGHEALEHLTRSGLQLKIIDLLELPFINGIDITFCGLQIKNENVTAAISNKIPLISIKFDLSNKVKILPT